jgi:hypothetical protein
MGVVFQKPKRPVWVGVRLGFQDLQGAIPRFWCTSCGAEVFLTGRAYCHRCEKEEFYDKQMGQPLQGLHTGAES